jgi:hypothetical protein
MIAVGGTKNAHKKPAVEKQQIQRRQQPSNGNTM